MIIIKNKNFLGVQIGFGGSNGVQVLNGAAVVIGKAGKIIFEGGASIGAGSSIRVDEGTLKFGNNFSCNKNCLISCSLGIVFGIDALLGWNVGVRDSDGHTILHEGQIKRGLSEVRIGDHVWIASFVDIMKGSKIPNDCVVGYRSCVMDSFTQTNCLIAGYPAKVIQEEIEWKR